MWSTCCRSTSTTAPNARRGDDEEEDDDRPTDARERREAVTTGGDAMGNMSSSVSTSSTSARAMTRSDSAREDRGVVGRSLSRASSARRSTREGEDTAPKKKSVSFATTIATTIELAGGARESSGTGTGTPTRGRRRRERGGWREAAARETTAREVRSGTRPAWASKAPPILSRDIFPGAGGMGGWVNE